MSLSPSGVAPVCPGDLLTVTCRGEGLSNADFIQWNITINVGGSSESEQRFLSAAGQNFIAPITLINMITLSFTLEAILNPDISLITLTSNLSVQDVTPSLNETVISCSAIAQNNSVVGPETTYIHVITFDFMDSGRW